MHDVNPQFTRTFKIQFILGLVLPFAIGCTQASTESTTVHKTELHTFTTQVIADNLNHPWGMVFINKDQALVTQRSGGIVLINVVTGTVKPVPGAPEPYVRGQAGLFDIDIHPDFKNNPYVYIAYAGKDPESSRRSGTEIAKGTWTGTELKDLEVIFKGVTKSSGSQHYGGRLAIDEQHLYLSLGDRGERDWAQDVTNHWGSMIRIGLDGQIPADNPSIKNAVPGIWSYGHRNPQGLAFHPQTKKLWQHEHGPQGGDEINVINIGENYGWPEVTYGKEYGTGFRISKEVEKPGITAPIYQWTPSIAPSGMAFYTGEKFKHWQGDLLVGSLKFKQLIRMTFDESQLESTEILIDGEHGRIRDVVVGPDENVYLLTDQGDGELVRLGVVNS